MVDASVRACHRPSLPLSPRATEDVVANTRSQSEALSSLQCVKSGSVKWGPPGDQLAVTPSPTWPPAITRTPPQATPPGPGHRRSHPAPVVGPGRQHPLQDPPFEQHHRRARPARAPVLPAQLDPWKAEPGQEPQGEVSCLQGWESHGLGAVRGDALTRSGNSPVQARQWIQSSCSRQWTRQVPWGVLTDPSSGSTSNRE